MDDNDIFKIPTENIGLFSKSYLERHPKTQESVKKYLVGLDKYQISLLDSISGRFEDPSHNVVAHKLFAELSHNINQISREELLSKEWPKTLEEAKLFLKDQPYWFLFDPYGASGQLVFASMLLSGQTYVDTENVVSWRNAQKYCRSKGNPLFCIDRKELDSGYEAMHSYQAKYIIKRLGEQGIHDLFLHFFDLDNFENNIDKFPNFLNETLGEDVFTKFIQQSKPNVVDMSELTHFDKLFEYPEWTMFTEEAHNTIIDRILRGKMADRQIKFYLSTDISNLGYVRLFPILERVLSTTEDIELFEMAEEHLAVIWALVQKHEELRTWLSRKIYDIFWPRIGSTRHVLEYSTYSDLQEEKQAFFNQALDWILVLPRLKGLNLELWQKLQALAVSKIDIQFVAHIPRVKEYVCAIKSRLNYSDKPAERYKYITERFDRNTRYLLLSQFRNDTEAIDYLGAVLNESTGLCRDMFDVRLALEVALRECIDPNIHERIVKYIVDNFEMVCEKAYLNSYSGAESLLKIACYGYTKYGGTALKELGERCLDFIPFSDTIDSSDSVLLILKHAESNSHWQKCQSRDLVVNLRKRTEETERQLAKERSK